MLARYTSMMREQKLVATKVASEEGALSEVKATYEGYLKEVLQKYGVSTIEELLTLRESKVTQATEVVTKIQQDCPEVFR